MSNCSHEAWDFGALQCPDCGAVKGHVADADYAKLEAEAQALRDEVAALRARVVVIPALRDVSASADPEYRSSATGYNLACGDMARINGMTVSEGLLRRLCEPLLSHADYVVARNELRALLSEHEGGNDVSNHQ
ncbi:TPA: hypothetical protein NJJ38_003120 [Pseudomonas aeruginosa]|nr:hypothetical protein [Pseudomonas aeruginosa]AMA37855.1 hypothetical protein DPADHS01_17925 [Pseudomonas aeruginosa DHS01]AMA38095.1 hypothetical protein DPADHS01_19190 [Pseudomonas aeruginosa DHS01]AWE83636.1 hypothetical protein CSC29_2784 [Pseudomonas aeruginosa]AWE88364.1 hypothetical protein CSC29_3140 [Pseudomonas aeruginosa]AWR42863.1 hypothetical protein CLH63_08960 [Pseudomonas aeruginosa]